MPQNWKTYKLGDFAKLRKENIQPKDFSGQKYIGLEHIGQGTFTLEGVGSSDDVSSNKSKFKAGDILYGKIRPYFQKVYQPNFDGICSTDIFVLNSKENGIVEQPFLYQLTKTKFFTDKAVETSTGTKMPRADWNSLSNIEFLIPPLPEQRAIASILSALDDKIELNLQMNKTLEDMAMTLYKHWFVDFGPFKDETFVESELGLIPEGWEVKKLGEILSIKHGYAFKGDFFTTDERQEVLLTPGNFNKNGGIQFNWSKQKFYSGKFPEDYILKKGDLLITLTDLTQSCEILGAPALIPDEDYKYLHNQRLGLVQLRDTKFTNEIIYFLANTYEYREFIKNSKTGSTVSHTAPNRIYDYKIAYPSNINLNELKDNLKNIIDKIHLNISENKTLLKQRDSLLPKLISGEISVKDV